MKFNTLEEYPMTARLFVIYDVVDNVPMYRPERVVNVRLITNSAGLGTVVHCNEEMFLGDKLAELRDVTGELLSDDEFTIRRRLPIVNVYGHSEGMSYSVTSATAATA